MKLPKLIPIPKREMETKIHRQVKDQLRQQHVGLQQQHGRVVLRRQQQHRDHLRQEVIPLLPVLKLPIAVERLSEEEGKEIETTKEDNFLWPPFLRSKVTHLEKSFEKSFDDFDRTLLNKVEDLQSGKWQSPSGKDIIILSIELARQFQRFAALQR